MNDDLDDLKSAMNAATPAPDADRRAENLALAMKNFDTRQGSGDDPRPTSDRPVWGLFRGVKTMVANFSMRGMLTGTTALAALGLVLVVPVLTDGPARLQVPVPMEEAMEAPAPQGGVRLSGAALEAMNDASGPQFQSDMDIEFSADDGGAAGLTVGRTAKTAADNLAAPAPMPDAAPMPQADTEAYPQADANPLKITTEDPVSTFSVDVDTASYAIVRQSLMAGQMPPRAAVRIEEMVNYFPYDYAAPEDGAAFRPGIIVTDTPWNPGTQLVQIALQGAQITERPPLNLVFLIDTSGSMNQPAKLPLLKQSFRLMLRQLQPDDQVAIVSYAGAAGTVLEATGADGRDTILRAIDTLQPGGGTAGQAGLHEAYALAANMAGEGEVSRVILATDGDFNVGLSDPEALKDYIATQRDSGTYLSVLGFGRGNLDDATMQALAQNGNGQAAYIDTLGEAQKVLVDQLTGALFPIATDVKVQVEFNPAQIAEYRLIGYETRSLRREDFANDAVDAGDIGAGHQVTALYEVTPVGSEARLTRPLRYGDAAQGRGDEIGFLRLRYKQPGEGKSRLIETPIGKGAGEAGFAAAIAGFGQLLRGSDYLGEWSYAEAIALAQASRGDDPFGYRQEAVRLMQLAQSLTW